MRILFVTEYYAPNILGGGETSLKLLCESLANNGHDITVVTFDDVGRDEIAGVVVLRMFKWKDRFSIVQIGRAMKAIVQQARGVDVIHGYNMFLYPYLGALASMLDSPVLVTLNNNPKLKGQGLRRIPRRLVSTLYFSRLGKLDRLTVLSAHQKDFYVDKGVPADRLEIIPNMVDPAFLASARRDTAGTRPIVRYIGMLHEHKGVATLIRAMKHLPGVPLFIHGKGNHLSALERLVADLGLEQQIVFMPFVPNSEIPGLLDQTDVLVHPGLDEEAFGRSVLEGMAKGVPVLVSDRGEPPNLVREKELIFSSGNEIELSQKLAVLLGDPQLRTTLGAKLKEKAQLDYSVERVRKQYEEVYSDVLSGAPLRKNSRS